MRRTCAWASSSEFTSARNGDFAPYRIVPVEYSRGAVISPARAISLAAKTIEVSADGLCVVVTPKANAASNAQLRSGMISSEPYGPVVMDVDEAGKDRLPLHIDRPGVRRNPDLAAAANCLDAIAAYDDGAVFDDFVPAHRDDARPGEGDRSVRGAPQAGRS